MQIGKADFGVSRFWLGGYLVAFTVWIEVESEVAPKYQIGALDLFGLEDLGELLDWQIGVGGAGWEEDAHYKKEQHPHQKGVAKDLQLG